MIKPRNTYTTSPIHNASWDDESYGGSTEVSVTTRVVTLRQGGQKIYLTHEILASMLDWVNKINVKVY